MNIKKTLSALMSLTMIMSSAAAAPVSYVNAEETAVMDTSRDAETKEETSEEPTEDEEGPASDNQYTVCSGYYSVSPPDKEFYQIGEEFDVTGGRLSGNGAVTVFSDEFPNGMSAMKWDNFGCDLKLTDLDISNFDNTKPGIYKISVAKIGNYFGGQYIDKDDINYSSFYVMVVDGEVTEEDREKLSEARTIKYILEGTVKVTQPDKKVYKTGEKLDLTGCTISGDGNIFKGSYNNHSKDYIGGWSIKERPLTLDDIDLSDINMKKAGTYTVPVNGFSVMDGYEINEDNTIRDYIEIEVTEDENGKDDKETVTTTTVTTENTGTKKSIIYTADITYDVKSVNTYPTQTIFLEGEELNTDGLNVKCERYIPYEDMGLNRKEYEVETIDKWDLNIAQGSITIIDKDGKKYDATRMCQLPAGKYTVKVNEDKADQVNYTMRFINADISYEIEIVSSDLLDEKTVLSGEKEIFRYKRNYAQEFKGVAQYPEKTVYKKGEELDLTGLIIKAKRIVSYPQNEDASQYEEEPVYLKTRLPQLDTMDITAADGTVYRGSKLSTLAPGKYTISCKSESVQWGDYFDVVATPDIKYEIEIKSAEDYKKWEESKTSEEKEDKNTEENKSSEEKGDANCDGELSMADAVLIMQSLANPDKYTITEQGAKNADITGDNDGITNKDALQIQKILLKLV